MNPLAIEIAPFLLAADVSEADMLAASDILEQQFLSRADGYLGRVLVRKDDQHWSDIVFWRSAAHAEKAMQQVADSEACRSYFQCMAHSDHDHPEEGVTLFQAMKHYGSLETLPRG